MAREERGPGEPPLSSPRGLFQPTPTSKSSSPPTSVPPASSHLPSLPSASSPDPRPIDSAVSPPAPRVVPVSPFSFLCLCELSLILAPIFSPLLERLPWAVEVETKPETWEVDVAEVPMEQLAARAKTSDGIAGEEGTRTKAVYVLTAMIVHVQVHRPRSTVHCAASILSASPSPSHLLRSSSGCPCPFSLCFSSSPLPSVSFFPVPHARFPALLPLFFPTPSVSLSSLWVRRLRSHGHL